MDIQQSTIDRVTTGLEGLAHERIEGLDEVLTLRVELDVLPQVMKAIRDACGFQISTFVTAVDHDVEREEAGKPRFDVIWQFQSVSFSDRLRIHSWAQGDEPTVPSIIELWPGAIYGERECYDMFGIRFEGHADLKRILMPEEYDHFPLRKDFPHQGIEPDKLYKAWDRKRRLTAGEEV